MGLNNIYDPLTGHVHSIFNNKGLNILKKYIKQFQTGGSADSSTPEPEWDPRKEMRGPSRSADSSTPEPEWDPRKEMRGPSRSADGGGGGGGKNVINTQTRKPLLIDFSKYTDIYGTYFNHPDMRYKIGKKTRPKSEEIYNYLPEKRLPKFVYRALRPRDLYWLFKVGSILSPCINCGQVPIPECCKVSAEYHIQTGSKPGAIKGNWLSLTSNESVAALFSAKTHKYTEEGEGFSVNVDPVMSSESGKLVFNNWGKRKGLPLKGYSGIFIKISTENLNLVDKSEIKFKSVTAQNNAEAAKEMLIEDRIPGENIVAIYLSKTAHKNDETHILNHNILGKIERKRYKGDASAVKVIWTDTINILMPYFMKINNQLEDVYRQPWFMKQMFPLLKPLKRTEESV
jgi:hypothetical protein